MGYIVMTYIGFAEIHEHHILALAEMAVNI